MSTNGFVDVVTPPAGGHSLPVAELGTFAPGVGPVIGSDGTVVLGTLEGKVIALHANGSAFWNRLLPPDSHQQIKTAAAIGRDQSVYVVGTYNATVNDHRGGITETVDVHFATLYWFTAGGGAPVGNSIGFPEVRQGRVPGMYGPRFTGAPSIWQSGNDEVVMVPAWYHTIGGDELHVVAFPKSGTPITQKVAEWNGGDVTGGFDWNSLPGGFDHGAAGSLEHSAMPALGIVVDPQQGALPFVMVTNRFQNQIVGYTFEAGSSGGPEPHFLERFRTSHAPHALLSAPTPLPDGRTAVATDRGVVFSGPNLSAVPPVTGFSAFAAPTVAADGRALIATLDHSVIGIRDHAIISRLLVEGDSAVQAAASRTHVFVSTTGGLLTLDATAESEVLRFPWVSGGGISPPAIGPDGHVYAMTSNILLVFPPPLRVPRPGVFVDATERLR